MTQLKVTSYDADGDGVHWSIYMTQLPDGVIVYLQRQQRTLFERFSRDIEHDVIGDVVVVVVTNVVNDR